jgi:hypothetical protein
MARTTDKNTDDNVKIYTIFFSPGWGWGGSKPPRFLLDNDALLEKLKSRCKGVDFISRDLSKKNPTFNDYIERNLIITDRFGAAVKEIKSMEKEIDGVLCFKDVRGDHRLTLTGLPTIAVNNLFEFNAIPYETYQEKGKVITADICRLNVVSPSAAESMFEDLVEKIRLIQVLKRMRESRILMVTDKRLRYYPQLKESKSTDKEWNETYLARLKETFGATGIITGTEEVSREMAKVEKEKAEGIAQMWIDESRGMGDTNKADVLKGARLYLALDKLKSRYNATSILTDTSSFLQNTKILACLPSMEFHKQGSICTDQPNTGPLIAQMLGLYYTGRPSFHGDLLLDTYNNTSIIVHCGAPINPHRDDRVPYSLRDYRMGADVLVELPTGEPVTIWRVNIMDKLILLHTGESIPIDSLYGQGINSLHTILCATKLVSKVDAEKIQNHLNPQRYGVHRAAIYGDYRKRIKDLAKLTGFDVLEEDR